MYLKPVLYLNVVPLLFKLNRWNILTWQKNRKKLTDVTYDKITNEGLRLRFDLVSFLFNWLEKHDKEFCLIHRKTVYLFDINYEIINWLFIWFLFISNLIHKNKIFFPVKHDKIIERKFYGGAFEKILYASLKTGSHLDLVSFLFDL